MRWNDTATLVGAPSRYQDEAGAWHTGEPTEREVFCNRRSVGATEWGTAIDAGLRADAEVQLRAIDYAGEKSVRFGGELYSVERVVEASSGELVRLTLGKKASDGS